MKSKNLLPRILFIVSGIGATLWFLIRVIPKPSRATYPCQRAAFPVASAFVIWLSGLIASSVLFRKSRRLLLQSVRPAAILAGAAALIVFTLSIFLARPGELLAAPEGSEPVVLVKDLGDVLDSLPAKVAIVQSDAENCYDLEYDEIENMIRTAVELAGGLESIVSDGDVVVLKPNLVGTNPVNEIFCNGKTTDPRVTEIVAKLVKEINPSGKVLVMEGSAYTDGTLAIMEVLGYGDMQYADSLMGMEETGDWYDFRGPMVDSVFLEEGLGVYPDELKINNSRAQYFHKQYLEADVLISIPVLKNHFRTGITGAVKNVGIGSTPGRLYGLGPENKAPLNRNGGVDHTITNLHRFIHDSYAGRPVDFVVMDGLQGLQNGPGGSGDYKSNQMNMRLILAGSDAIAVDAIEGLITSHDPSNCNHLVLLHNDGYGMADVACIEVVGPAVEDLRRNYSLPANSDGLESQFNHPACDSYFATSCSVDGDSLFVSLVSNSRLARVTFRVDGQPLNKFVIGGFEDIRLSLAGIDITGGSTEIRYEDKYLNSRTETVEAHFVSAGPLAAAPDLEVYPNPFTGLVRVRIPESLASAAFLRITDLQGRMLKEFSVRDREIQELSLEDLAEGSYLLLLSDHSGKVLESRILVR